jgi:hypothetical protein
MMDFRHSITVAPKQAFSIPVKFIWRMGELLAKPAKSLLKANFDLQRIEAGDPNDPILDILSSLQDAMSYVRLNQLFQKDPYRPQHFQGRILSWMPRPWPTPE